MEGMWIWSKDTCKLLQGKILMWFTTVSLLARVGIVIFSCFPCLYVLFILVFYLFLISYMCAIYTPRRRFLAGCFNRSYSVSCLVMCFNCHIFLLWEKNINGWNLQWFSLSIRKKMVSLSTFKWHTIYMIIWMYILFFRGQDIKFFYFFIFLRRSGYTWS